jgi:diadenosine tetraphosphatase ApaH/serine/threonine PP2A family protein phosphatase
VRTSHAGASAAAEFERRRRQREESIRVRHPKLGGLIVALSDEPQSTTAWARGAVGERRLGGALEGLGDEAMVVLHDRRIPGSRANIDHLVVAPRGVYIIDTKAYKGRVEFRRGGWLSKRPPSLFVGGRDRSSLVAGMAKQIDAVERVLAGHSDAAHARVLPALCFFDSDWGLLDRPFNIEEVWVGWPRALGKLLRQPGPLSAPDRGMIGAWLDASLLPAGPA